MSGLGLMEARAIAGRVPPGNPSDSEFRHQSAQVRAMMWWWAGLELRRTRRRAWMATSRRRSI